MPRSRSRSSRRSRNTSPRALAISSKPMVSPSSRSGRGNRWVVVGLRSDVGSRSTVIASPPYLLGYGNAAAGAARGPAADNAGEHPGPAAGADDQEPARAELVDGLAGERSGAAFGDAPGAGDQI